VIRTHKRCPKCRKTKAVSEFYKVASTSDRFRSWCKKCHLSRQKIRYRKNRTAHLAQNRRWYKENKASRLAQCRIYEQSLVGSRLRVVTGLVMHHPGLSRVTAEKFMELIFYSEAECSVCGLKEGQRARLKAKGWGWLAGIGSRLELDHKDGNNRNHAITNLRPLCRHCNSYRGANERSDHETLVHAHKHYSQIPASQTWWLRPVVYQKGMNEVSCNF
jgi:hypothetical protein